MPATPLGPDALKVLLAGYGHVLVANRTDTEDGVTIIAAAIARHYTSGEVKRDTIHGLQLEADASVGLDPMIPHHEDPEAVEVLLRVRVEAVNALEDAYVLLQRPAGETLVRFEVGVRTNTGVLDEGEEMLGEFAQFVVYGRPAGGGA